MNDIGRLHVITDRLSVACAALDAGAPVVQLRDKHCSDRELFDVVRRVVAHAGAVGGRVIVDDRVHVAVAAKADGAHVGADDLPVAAARRVLGHGAVLGGTARDPETAIAQQAAGASYVGVGPVYPTSSKDGLPAPLGPAGLSRVAAAVDVPVIAISGVTAARVPELVEAGAYGVAVISAVASASDPAVAVTELLDAIARAVSR